MTARMFNDSGTMSASSWLNATLSEFDKFIFSLQQQQHDTETKKQPVMAWLNGTALPGITETLAIMNFQAIVTLERFGSTASGYDIGNSDSDMIVLIAGCTVTDEATVDNIEAFCANFLLVSVRKIIPLSTSTTRLLTEHVHNNTVKFVFNGHKVDLRVVVGNNFPTKSVQLMAKQLEQVQCIRWHREKYDHLSYVLPTIIWWAKTNGICHDGNMTEPPSISSLKSVHWAYLICLVAPAIKAVVPIDALVETMRALSKLPLRTHKLKFIKDGGNGWAASWERSEDRDGCSMLHIVDGAYSPTRGYYDTAEKVEKFLDHGLKALSESSFNKFLVLIKYEELPSPYNPFPRSAHQMPVPPAPNNRLPRFAHQLTEDLYSEPNGPNCQIIYHTPDRKGLYHYLLRCSKCGNQLETCSIEGDDTAIKDYCKQQGWHVPDGKKSGKWSRTICNLQCQEG